MYGCGGCPTFDLMAGPRSQRPAPLAVRRARRIALQRVGHDVARDRSRRGGAGIAMLHHHRQRVARRIVRRVGDEQRVRAVLPRAASSCRNCRPRAARAIPGAPAPSRSCRPSASADRPASPAARCRPARSPPPTCPRAPHAGSARTDRSAGQSSGCDARLQLARQLARQVRLHLRPVATRAA